MNIIWHSLFICNFLNFQKILQHFIKRNCSMTDWLTDWLTVFLTFCCFGMMNSLLFRNVFHFVHIIHSCQLLAGVKINVSYAAHCKQIKRFESWIKKERRTNKRTKERRNKRTKLWINFGRKDFNGIHYLKETWMLIDMLRGQCTY